LKKSRFKIKEKITYTIALTLFIIIFITALIFTQLFIIHNRDIQLSELSSQNQKFTEFLENNYNNKNESLINFINPASIRKIENIIETRITIIDENQNILINPLELSNETIRKVLFYDKEIRRFFIFSTLTNKKEQFGKLINYKLLDKKYYISISEFKINNVKHYSVFTKKQSDLEIPPVKYFLYLLFIFLIASVISIIAGVLLGRHLTNPILKLNKSVGKISKGVYSEKINIAGTDEISMLAENINIMKDKIKRSQASLEEFPFIVSHEIKNMLASINGYSTGIKEGIYYSKEEIENALNIIISKTSDLENITDSLLMLSKIENKITELTKDKIDIKIILEDLLKLYEPELSKNNLRINTKINLGRDIQLYTDKYLLQTILSNLINNAIKYSNPGSAINTSVYSKDQYIVFKISNESVEISKDDKEKIFKMFYRSKRFDFKNIKGFGLGLAISKKIATFLNANLKLETSGKVNTFSLEIVYK
jgi:signal transduction histidine kinase